MRLVVGITGSIAAYRSPDLVKDLVARGFEVQVILTRSARELVSARALSTLSGREVAHEDPFAPGYASTDHIALARWAERVLVYGATADFIARAAHGFAGDTLSLQLLATHAPVVFAPAMNPSMWAHPAVQANVELLRSRGVVLVGPTHGRVACGETGVGHIATHEAMIEALALEGTEAGESPWTGRRVLISMGAMRTSIDAVRFVQNRSSGKMGLALAQALQAQGAHVTCLVGPVDATVEAALPAGAVRYDGPADYGSKLAALFEACDVFFSAAAVLDFEVVPFDGKLVRESGVEQASLVLPTRTTPDFVAEVAKRKRADQRVVAFALEASDLPSALKRGRAKLVKKAADALLLNTVTPELPLGGDENHFYLLTPNAPERDLGRAPKRELATRALARLARELFSEHRGAERVLKSTDAVQELPAGL